MTELKVGEEVVFLIMEAKLEVFWRGSFLRHRVQFIAVGLTTSPGLLQTPCYTMQPLGWGDGDWIFFFLWALLQLPWYDSHSSQMLLKK